MHEHAEAGEHDVERVGEQKSRLAATAVSTLSNPIDAAISLKAASTATEA